MKNLTHQEEVTLMMGGLILILIVIGILFIQPISSIKLILVGLATIALGLVISYIFIIQPIRTRSSGSSIYSHYSSRTFKPTVIPPSKTVKKTVMKGKCQFCGKPALMGFTCSYCNDYFCAEHRLPEKHRCLGLRNR